MVKSQFGSCGALSRVVNCYDKQATFLESLTMTNLTPNGSTGAFGGQKKSYTRPSVTVCGSVADLTAGTGSQNGDGTLMTMA